MPGSRCCVPWVSVPSHPGHSASQYVIFFFFSFFPLNFLYNWLEISLPNTYGSWRVCVCRGGKYKTDPRSVSKCNSHLASFKLVKQSRWIRNDVDLGPRLGCWARSRAWYCEVFFLDWSTRGFETLYVALGGGWGWDRYIFWFIFSFLSLKSLVIVIFLYLPIILFVLNWVWILLAFFVYISNVFFFLL